ncbi:MAG: transposase [Flavobacteriaceae bacterium]|nr:transposase [Flavobacteriaceae bacterium]
MKKYLYFIGIDVSKLKLDITIRKENELHQSHHFIITNDKKGLKELLQYLKNQGIHTSDVLFSFEDTGVYSMPLCCFLSDKQLDYWMIPAIEIKRSKGLVRGKSDKADSKDIAIYSHTHFYKLRLGKIPEKDLLKLRLLWEFELEGFEYYFSADGRLLSREHANNNILVQSSMDATAVNSKNFSVVDELKYSNFIPWSSAPPETRNEVAKAIYKREIGGKINSITSKGQKSSIGASISDIGDFNVNPHSRNQRTGTLLNNDYYNMTANLQHEEGHYVDLQNGVDTDKSGSNPWRHFQVHTNAILENKDTFNKTTSEYKEFSQKVAKGYINSMTRFLTVRAAGMNPEVFKSDKDIQNALSFLKNSINKYNSIYDQKMKIENLEKINLKMYDDRKD